MCVACEDERERKCVCVRSADASLCIGSVDLSNFYAFFLSFFFFFDGLSERDAIRIVSSSPGASPLYLSPLPIPVPLTKREICLCERIYVRVPTSSRCKAVTTDTFASVNNARNPKWRLDREF